MADHAHTGGNTHVTPLKIYYAVFGTLMLLTGVTVGVAYIDLGALNVVAAVAIACFKALIVVLYFMHVKFSTRLIKLTVVAGLYWMLILMGITLGDYLTRGWGTYSQQLGNFPH